MRKDQHGLYFVDYILLIVYWGSVLSPCVDRSFGDDQVGNNFDNGLSCVFTTRPLAGRLPACLAVIWRVKEIPIKQGNNEPPLLPPRLVGGWVV